MSYSDEDLESERLLPADPRERRRLYAVVAIILVTLTIGIGGYYLLLSQQTRGKQDAKQAWDNGIGHPEAAIIARNDTKDVSTLVPQTLESANSYWGACHGRACLKVDVGRYPTVLNLESMPFSDDCSVIRPKTPVIDLHAASTKGGGRYKLTYNADGTQINICALSRRHNGDQIVLWSEDIAATP